MDNRSAKLNVNFFTKYTEVLQGKDYNQVFSFTFTGVKESLQTSLRIYSVEQIKMDKIKDAIQGIIDEAESKSELPPQDVLEEAAEISGTVTFGLISLLAKALRTFKSAVKEDEIQMQLQDQLRDRWGTNAPDLDVSI